MIVNAGGLFPGLKLPLCSILSLQGGRRFFGDGREAPGRRDESRDYKGDGYVSGRKRDWFSRRNL